MVAAVVLGAPVAAEDASEPSPPASEPAPAPAPTPEPEPEPAPSPSPSYAPGMAPGEHGGWVAVDSQGNQVSGVMVCTPEVCGQSGPGSFASLLYPGRTDITLVIKFLQDPVEAANSANGVGNVAGHNGGTYNHSTGQWTYTNSAGQVYQIPLAYPGTDRGGNSTVDVLLYDPVDDDSVNEPAAPDYGIVPDEDAQAARDALVSSVRDALPLVADVEAANGVVFTSAAADRRTTIGANIASAVSGGSSAGGVQEAQRLVWLYTWAAVRGLPEEDRAEVRAELRTAAGDSALERRIRAQASELALLDVAASLTLTDLANTSALDRCAVALTYAQGRIARTACQPA